MNRGALRSVARNYSVIQEKLLSIRSAVLKQNSSLSSLQLLWATAYCGWSIPTCSAFQAGLLYPAIDDASADLSKLCHGLLTLADSIYRSLELHKALEWTAADFMRHLHHNKTLLGLSEVCAAPSSMIFDVLNTILLPDHCYPTRACSPIFDHLVAFCEIRWQVEYGSILYESARYIRQYDNVRESQHQRYCLPYCNLIAQHFRAGLWALVRLLGSYELRGFFGQNNGSQEIGIVMLRSAIYDFIITPLVFTDRAKKFALAQSMMLDLLNNTEKSLSALNGLIAENQHYSIKDLELFFG